MPMDAERFVERAFQVLFERAADAGDRARREAARGPSPDQAFEDGRVLTFYEVIRELWGARASESSRSFATRSASASRGRGFDGSGTSVTGTLRWSIQALRTSNS